MNVYIVMATYESKGIQVCRLHSILTSESKAASKADELNRIPGSFYRYVVEGWEVEDDD